MQFNFQVQEDGVGNLHFSGGSRRNSIGLKLAQELKDWSERFLFKSMQSIQVGKTPDCRTLLITAEPSGSGPTWISGGDLQELAKIQDLSAVEKYCLNMQQFLQNLENLPQPTLAVVDGAVIGGGNELLLAVDCRIASEQSTFCFKQVQIGLATGYGGAARLKNQIGESQSRFLLFTGQVLGSKKALDLGIVHEVTKNHDLHARAAEMTQYLAALEPQAVLAQRKMLLAGRKMSFEQCQDYERDLFKQLWRNPTHDRFLQKWQKTPGEPGS